MEVGRAWAGGKAIRGEDDLESDMDHFQVSSELRERLRKRKDESHLDVLVENLPALQVFLDCATQWRYAGMSVVATGLEYPSVQVVMNIHRTPSSERADVLWRVRALEAGALKQWAAQREKG